VWNVCGMLSLVDATHEKLQEIKASTKKWEADAKWSLMVTGCPEKRFWFYFTVPLFCLLRREANQNLVSSSRLKVDFGGFGACINKWSACSDRFLITQTAVDILDARAYGTRWGIDRYKKNGTSKNWGQWEFVDTGASWLWLNVWTA